MAYGISENHLVKIIHHLGKLGFLETKRGEINLGEVVRSTETLALTECLGADGGRCPIVQACLLKKVIIEARDAFLETFDRYTLSDILQTRWALLDSLPNRVGDP